MISDERLHPTNYVTEVPDYSMSDVNGQYKLC